MARRGYFLLYAVIGGAAAAVDYLTFFLIETNTSVSPEAAGIFGQLLGFLFSFTMNTFVNFKKTDKLLRRFMLYFGVTAVGMAISTTVIAIFKSVIDVFVLKLFCLFFVSIIQFFLNKHVTYRT